MEKDLDDIRDFRVGFSEQFKGTGKWRKEYTLPFCSEIMYFETT
jgi:hypothetical protein